jgi:hypothetical protein
VSILQIPVDNPDELLNTGFLGAGALGRWERSATGGGIGFAEIGTFALVTGTRLYTVYDPSGAVGSFYRVRYSKSDGSAPTPYSPEWVSGPDIGAYASLATFRAFLRDQAGTTSADGDVELLALEAAARAIDRECGRQFHVMTTATARVYAIGLSTMPVGWPLFGRRFAVDTDDFADVAGMQVAFDATGNGSYTTVSTAYRPTPFNGPAKGFPYTGLLFDIGLLPPFYGGMVQVTAKWGWLATPPNVVYANLIQASRFLKRRDSPYGVAGSPDMGNEIRLLAKLDPDVALSLRSYKAEWGNQ